MTEVKCWRVLGDCADLLSGGTPSKDNPRYWGGAIPWLSAKDMKSFFVDDTEDHVTEIGAANGTRAVEAGGTLVLTRGMTLLKDVPICVARRRLTFNQDVKAIVARPEVDPRYIAYALLAAKPALLAAVELAGHGTGRLPTDRLANLPIRLPALQEQRAITSILGALDDKIDLNRRTNETLEATARAFFRSWFVDFDPVRAKTERRRPSGMDAETAKLFPARFAETEAGEVPEGWRLGVLGDIAVQRRDGVHPAEVSPDTPYIGLEHMPQRSIALAEWSTAAHAESQKSRMSRGDILFGKLRPYFHKVGVAPVDGICSTDIVVVRPKESRWFSLALGHMSSDAFVAFTNAGSDGTRMPRTSWERMASYGVVVPTSACVEAFDRVVRPLVARIHAGIFQNATLAALRDALLPRLLSGEISLSAVERVA